jgi:hypothetical protein
MVTEMTPPGSLVVHQQIVHLPELVQRCRALGRLGRLGSELRVLVDLVSPRRTYGATT